MIQIYCDVDEVGNITDVLMGERIIPDRQYAYFFLVDQEIGVANLLSQYRVEIQSFKPSLLQK